MMRWRASRLMSTFSADWLALREPADAAARARRLTEQLAKALESRRGEAHPRADAAIRILDLGAGTGSNLRHLAPHFQGDQEWLLVDHDRRLLDTVADRTTAWATGHAADASREGAAVIVRGLIASRPAERRRAALRVSTRTVDLRAGVDDRALFADRHLVTASALIDLVSEVWLHALAARCADAQAMVLLALAYDGRISCTPEEPEDEMVRELVNRHQRTDKGFGPATGPDAVEIAGRGFADVGHEVHRARSDWDLPPEDAELQRQLIDGWAAAASEIAPEHATTIAQWRTRRIAHIDARRSRIIVGHEDLVAFPRFRHR